MTLSEKFEEDCREILDTDPVIPVFQKRGSQGDYALDHVNKAFEVYRLAFMRSLKR